MPTTDKSIADLLTQAQNGTLVLPEFQREYVWKLQDIRSFLASLCLDYPVGSFLTVEDQHDLFAARSLQGMGTAGIASAQGTVVYLLDGQQRLTSCHLVFSDSYKDTEVDDVIRRRWFLKLSALGLNNLIPLDAEQLMQAFEDDGGALHAQKINLRAKNRPEFQLEDDPELRKWCLQEGLYPLSFNVLKGSLNHTLLTRIASKRVTEIAAENGWADGSTEYTQLELKKDAWVNWITHILNSLSKRTIPVLQIEQGATLEKVARVFETVNKTGITLSLFELFVARATASEYTSLRKVIEETRKGFAEEFNGSVLGQRAPEWDPGDALESSNVMRLFDAEFPKLVATLVQLADSKPVEKGDSLDLGKRTILRTRREAINQRSAEAARQLFRAFAFLQVRCGVPWQFGNCPYQAMILPLAVALDNDTWKSPAMLDKLEAWYWAAIFSGRYKESQDARGREDVFIVRKYVNEGGPKPELVTNLSLGFVEEKTFQDADNSTDGIYRATLQYVLSRRPYDLRPGNHILKPEVPNTREKGKDRTRKLEDHHIIPKSWVAKNRKDLPSSELVDCCLNRAWVSFEANRGRTEGVFDQSPAQYLKSLPKDTLTSLLLSPALTDEQADPLQLMIDERYKLLRFDVMHRVTALA